MLKKVLILSLILCLQHFSSSAKHIVGGDFYCTWISGNDFKITLILYRDCTDPTASPFDQSITVAVYDKVNNAQQQFFDMYLGPVTPLQLAGNLCSPPPNVCLQKGIYEETITLPNNTHGYYLIWERCCRNATIVNLNNPQNEAMAFYLEIPNPAIHNSSPVFLNAPLPYMCLNQPWTYNFAASDPDGDSIVSYFATPLNGGHTSWQDPNPFSNAIPTGGGGQVPPPGSYTPVSWASGYGTFNIVDGNPTLAINSQTGLMTCTPVSLGMYAMAVIVEEYKNGVLIGRVRREIEFAVIDCNQNDAPSLSVNVPLIGGTHYNVFAGDTLCLQVTVTDPTDSLFSSHSGNVFYPGVVTHNAVTSDVTGFKNIKLNFCWESACADLTNSPYQCHFEVIDNGCPLPKTKKFDFELHVLPPPLVQEVNLLCLKFLSTNSVQVYFGDTSSVPAKFFKYFLIYRSTNGGPFALLDTLFDKSLGYFIDSTAINAATIDYCYYLTGYNTCDFAGPTSDTLCTLSSFNTKTNYVATVTVSNPDEITLKWEHFPDGPFSTFFVYRRENDSISPFSFYKKLDFPNYDSYVDNNVSTSTKSYSYYLTNEDFCENVSPNSNYGSSILLTGIAAPFVNRIHWTLYEQWDGGVVAYEIWRQKDEKSAFELLTTVSSSTFDYVDDKLDITGGRFAYKIVAIEGPGSMDEKSTSNEIILIQSPLIYIPNAFTPNSDSNNETWAPKSVFIKDYDLRVFNRWGQLVFQSGNETESWNGHYKGAECQQGVYFYVLKFSGYDKPDTYTRTGSVTILR